MRADGSLCSANLNLLFDSFLVFDDDLNIFRLGINGIGCDEAVITLIHYVMYVIKN